MYKSTRCLQAREIFEVRIWQEVHSGQAKAFSVSNGVKSFKDLKNLAEECSRLLSTFISSVKKNETRGLQRKMEKPADWLDEEMARQDLGVTPRGLKSRRDAEAGGLAVIKDFKEIVSRNKKTKI